MSVEQDIQQLGELVKRIEDYADRAVWNPEQHKEILVVIEKADAIFDEIITGYIEIPDKPSFEQTYLVSNLQERLHHAKHSLPSPPIEQEPTGKGVDKKVTLYTTPT